ncbi:hypothetical protein EVAR_7302_1 [Eumeta japonica]|uniref:Uncharacterized protein n=1 Tax=Eumeta variegata TaxID=151549 RepID=A0A4C1T3G4_EUMVA|nr:hypothetical protein EVAR_7302_1 [Eumeta japonica]
MRVRFALGMVRTGDVYLIGYRKEMLDIYRLNSKGKEVLIGKRLFNGHITQTDVEVEFLHIYYSRRPSFWLKVARISAGSPLPSLLIQNQNPARTYTPPYNYAPFGISGLVPFSHCDWLKVER